MTQEMKDTVRLVAIMLFAALMVNYADAANLLTRGGIQQFQFDKAWEADYREHAEYDTEKSLYEVYWDDDELFFYNGRFYLNNPDRAFWMIPLHFETEWEKQEFEKDFLEYISTDNLEEFTKKMDSPCKWGVYLLDGMYWVYQYDI